MRRKGLVTNAILLIALLSSTLALMNPAAAQDVAPSQDGVVVLQTQQGQAKARVSNLKFLPQQQQIPPEEQALRERAMETIFQANASYRVPSNPNARFDREPLNPPTIAKYAGSNISVPSAPSAPGDLVIYQDAIPRTGGDGSPHEPTGDADGRFIFYTGNTYARVSMDYGQTFTAITLPASPLAGTVVCCDQTSYYDRTRGQMFWFLQYTRTTAGNNAISIARARGQRELAGNQWTFWDLTPQDFGYANDRWFDFPDIATSNNNLYVTTNVFVGTTFDGSLIMRIDLDQLAAGGTIDYQFLTTTMYSLRLANGAGAVMYFASHVDNDTVRVYSWAENSGPVSQVDRDINAWNNGSRPDAPSSDGTNWADGHVDRVLTGWVENNRVGFMWGAAQSSGGSPYPYPNVQYARFNLSDLNLSDQGVIWNAEHAWLFPSAHPNERGDIGGTIALGGGISAALGFPSFAVWIADGFNNRQIVGLDNLVVTVGNSGPRVGNCVGGPSPKTPPCYRWGDYLSTRRHARYDTTWIGTGYVQNGGQADANMEPHYVWFGREQDQPPASHTIYADSNHSGWQSGAAANPYRSVFDANFACVRGDTVRVRVGTYNQIGVLDRACTIIADSGPVTIGK